VYLHLHRLHQPNQYVFLKLGNSSKLEARYYGQFEILERIRSVAYMFPLLASMIIHNVFYVSLLKKYIPDASHVIDWNVILVEQGSTFQVHSIRIMVLFQWCNIHPS
jgi:hypothetical protein